MKKQTFLVQFEYEYYCQGYEWTTETLLVAAKSFDDVCYKILDLGKYTNAKNFRNKTLQ